ncbi:BQ2448_5416 [Microbotryum intermedium]|uniref:BQ2448_5416 protein n=1 Tax=Microbotryum intermedium TaxID=269621 RepID=A0A238F454_9BASI|nr:BQ2448_5416 [Microbotryum intermedium]
MSTYLAESLNSIARSSALIDALTFRRTRAFSRAILATEEQFEAHMIRDAEPYELALFRPTLESRYDALDGGLMDDDAENVFGASSGAGAVVGGEEKWTAAKRGGPQRAGAWDKASPLKERKGTAAAEDPDRCLRAALKLLSIYPLPRATEHVEALQHQFNGLLETMVEHEEALKRPIARAAMGPHEQELQRASDLEDAIKREQMEIFALEQIHAEKQAEVIAVPAETFYIPVELMGFHRKQVAAASSKTRTRRIPMAKAPPPGPGEVNPFAKSDMLEKRAEAIMSQSTPARACPVVQAASATRTTPRANRGATSATSSPRSPVKSTPPPKSPASRSPGGTTPKRTPLASSSPGSSRQITPRAARPPAGVRSSPAKASPKKSKDDDLLPSGVTSADLVQYSTKLWATLGDPIRPWARKAVPRQEQDAAAAPAEEILSIADTLATLRTAVTAASMAPVDPVSPARSHTTTTTANEDDPMPPSSALAMEYEALNLILSTLSRTPLVPPPSASLPPLSITLRDAVLPSSLGSAGATTFVAPPPGKKDPMISMNALKLHLSDFAKARGWAEDLVTPTIYSLVSKQVLRIDRRGKEGPMLGFKV